MALPDVANYAALAVKFDTEGNKSIAAYYYNEAAKLIIQLVSSNPNLENLNQLQQKASEFGTRASALQQEVDNLADEEQRKTSTLKSGFKADYERAYFLFSEGLDEDEAGNTDEAVQLYTEAVDVCIKARKQVEDVAMKEKLQKVATQALERAESLKGIRKEVKRTTVSAQKQQATRVVPPLGIGNLNLRDEEPSPTPSAPTGGYTDEEKKVLAVTSLVNGREYVPFLSVDLRERFAYPVPFTDKHGKLDLSPKQKQRFVRWVRPEDFIENPKIFEHVSEYAVKQTVVSDCSFVASIAISAQYEKRFQKKLITSLIYPQNKEGKPVYNPCGKYMVKLMINGVSRKVVIDDYFPMGQHGELLCSYSSNKSELWISLLEKAYMKVMGGYDFPGSNSNIDLYALTGWIPERVSIRPNDPTFNKDAEFKKLFERFHRGDVLATVATGEMSDSAADRAGLVPTHAYALIDIREVKGVRLFKLKNPWSHLRWKGNYSELDLRHWTEDMKRALDYDPKSAQNFDNGVFWIDYESLCQFFDVIYMNWSPSLFKHTYAIHHTWHAGSGPAKDLYNISANPQYSLELGAGSGPVWILLTRHITDIEDFRNNKEYITVLVYKNNGQKVYYPFDPPPYIDGVRINSPHYLCKTVIKEDMPRKFTLVVSQYEKSSTIHYTLRIYSTLPFSLKKIPNPFKYRQDITGEWKGVTAGGCANYRETYDKNPRYHFTLDHDTTVLIELKGPKQFQIGYDVHCVVANNPDSPKYKKHMTSGSFRSGYAVRQYELVAGTYNIVPATFYPGKEAPFILVVQSPSPLKVGRLQ